MISKAWYVQCDRCGDPAEISCFGALEARRFAENQGYVRLDEDGKKIDLCFGCAPRNEYTAN